MATGKQLSFMSGEVSPEFQYNSQEISYATGLKKLTNAYVRKAGGISNRPGFMIMQDNPLDQSSTTKVHGASGAVYDFTVKESGLGPNITSFSFWNNIDKRWDILELGYFDDANPTVLQYRYNFSDPANVAPLDYNIRSLGGSVITQTPTLVAPPIQNMRFVTTEDSVIMFPYVWYQALSTDVISGNHIAWPVNISFDLTSKTWKPYGIDVEQRATLSSSSQVASKGLSPFIPVSYLVTLQRADGYEYVVGNFTTTVSDITTWDPSVSTNPAPWFPHAQMSVMFKLILTDTYNALNSAEVKGGEVIKLYRATWGSDVTKLFYKLAATSTYDPATLTSSIQDYGEADPSLTPPLNFDTVIQMPQLFLNSGEDLKTHSLGQATFGSYLQQRLHAYCEMVSAEDAPAALSPAADTFAKKAQDTFLASKMNTPKQFVEPLIFSDTEAFSYSLTSLRNVKKVAMLAMQRLVIFTTGGAHVIRGGTEGAITPTELNPMQISSVGCHEVVEPKMVGNKGYYLSNDNTRIMAIEWSDQGQLNVFEASQFSSHLLEYEEFVRMEALSNKENSLLLLTSRGRLIHVTFNFDLKLGGFSIFELTDGYIENIVPLKTKKLHADDAKEFEGIQGLRDSLGAYVIRNGKRSFEMLALREDNDTQTMMYMDSAVSFGTFNTSYVGAKKLSRATFPLRINAGATFTDTAKTVSSNQRKVWRMNIGDDTTTNWTAGQAIRLHAEGDTFAIDDVDKTRIDFYYLDTDGITLRTLRGRLASFTPSSSTYHGFDTLFSVVFETDVPASLRDVYNQNLLADEKNYRYTNYSFAYSYLPQAVLKQIYDRRPANIPSESPVPVSLYADRWVVSSPLNPDYAGKICYVDYDSGTDSYSIDLGGDFFAFGFIGYPYKMLSQTLPIEASDNRTFHPGKVIVNSVGMALYKTMGGFVGMPDGDINDMARVLSKYSDPFNFTQMPTAFTGYDHYSIPSEYAQGIVEFQHVDPTPFTLMAVYPQGQASY